MSFGADGQWVLIGWLQSDKRLPGRVFVVVLVLAVSSAADWPWGAGTRVRLCRHPRPV